MDENGNVLLIGFLFPVSINKKASLKVLLKKEIEEQREFISLNWTLDQRLIKVKMLPNHRVFDSIIKVQNREIDSLINEIK